MKTDRVKHLGAAMTMAVLLLTAQVSAQQPRYKLIDLGTLGGPQSYIPDGSGVTAVGFLNNKGVVAAFGDTADPDPFPNLCFVDDCYVTHAFGVRKGIKTDLGVLVPGVSSSSTWISSNGFVAGVSENGELDPLVPGFPQLRAVLWRGTQIVDLGTLEGGYESAANAVNNAGQVVGGATNDIPDPNSIFGLGYEGRAFLWERGAMRDLGTLGTGSDAQAALINDRGQVVGWSYTSSDPSDICAAVYGFPISTGSFIWEKGKGMVDIGGLGGSCTVAADLNEKGEIVGQSWSTGDLVGRAFHWDSKSGLTDLGTVGGGDFSGAHAINSNGSIVGGSTLAGNLIQRATLWKHGVAIDLGAVDSDTCSYAFGINNSDQVVGISGTTNCASTRAFLWEPDGSIVDLNSLVSSNSGIHLTFASTINDRGEIGGLGVLPSGDEHAVLLVPCREGDDQPCETDSNRTSARVLNPFIWPKQSPSIVPGRNLPRLSHRPSKPTRSPGVVSSLISGVLNVTPAAEDPNAFEEVLSDKTSCAKTNGTEDDLLDIRRIGAAAQCVPFGQRCYGPGPTRCCPAPFPHHSFCSSRTGYGTCLYD